MNHCITSLLSPLAPKFDHRTKKSQYCGLHTPTYRALNFAQKFILDSRISGDFAMNTFSGQCKSIVSTRKDLRVRVSLSYGRGIVEVNGNRIFFVCENTKTIHHIDINGVYHTCEYHQNYKMDDVIAQITEVLEQIKETYVEPPAPVPYVHDWRLEQEFGTKPQLKPVSPRSVEVTATLKRMSKKFVAWDGHYRDRKNRNYTKTERISFPTAYLVEIDGVEAWLPHSILGENYEPVFTCYEPARTIAIPKWWMFKNIWSADK